MDTPKAVTHVSLCAGYGGIDLGLKRAIPNLRTVAFSEIEAFACANLVAKMEAGCLDPAPIWTDVKTFPWEEFCGKVDILSGGYPCQPFSAAGKRLGKDDPRHLWPWIADGIRVLQPALCFFENVEGHISLGLSTVVSDLEGLGYKVAFGLFSASEVGAPHQRKRIFVLAHRIGERGLVPHQWIVSGQQMPVGDGQARGTWPSRPGQPQHRWEPPRVVGDADCGGQPLGLDAGSSRQTVGRRQSNIEPTECRQTEPALGRDVDGPAGRLDYAELCVSGDNRTDELRLLGNGVVPATAERAFRTFINRLFP